MKRPRAELSGRNVRWVDRAVDAVVAAFATGAAVVLHAEVAAGSPPGPLATVGVAAAAVHGASTLFRRSHPVAVLVVLLLSALVTVLLGFPAYMLGPAVLFAMYSAGTQLPRRSSAAAAAAVTTSVALLVAAGPAYPGPASTVFYAVLAAAAWWLGTVVRRSRTAAEEHARRADELAATREELARYAVSEERRRIARELHDVVAHSMTVVAMHAGTGRMVAGKDPSAAVTALATVERLSREALQDMRRLVGLLRAGGEEDDGLAPAPGLADLHRLVAEVVGTGMAVEVKTSGDLDTVPPGPALAAYRIVQEALTNAVRHSGAARAELVVELDESELRISITNGPPEASIATGGDGGGMGMVGMRERVALYDGTLTAGPLPDGGYRVEARIPIDRAVR
ncbi:MAG TPA: sensor histidine kinase [Actinomycetota bacterium]|nr:sensor histidine kinase [Actinomycetota bacterium]